VLDVGDALLVLRGLAGIGERQILGLKDGEMTVTDPWEISLVSYLNSAYRIPLSSSVTTVERIFDEDSQSYGRFSKVFPPNGVVIEHIAEYSNGIAFYIYRPMIHYLDMVEYREVGGYPLRADSAQLYFYVYETSTFLRVAWHDETEVIDALSIDVIRDLGWRYVQFRGGCSCDVYGWRDCFNSGLKCGCVCDTQNRRDCFRMNGSCISLAETHDFNGNDVLDDYEWSPPQDSDFDGSTLLVLVPRGSDVYATGFFGDFPIEDITDISSSVSPEQILVITLPDDCKDNVVAVIRQLMRSGFVAEPNYFGGWLEF
jgi:hypothetical protein